MMGRNYQLSLELRQFFNVRWFDSNQRATSLAEVLADGFLGDETFESFYEREKKGDSPRLIINTTLYNNGRRLSSPRSPETSSDTTLSTSCKKTWVHRARTPRTPRNFRSRCVKPKPP